MTKNKAKTGNETPAKLKQAALARHFEVTSRRIRTLETEGHFKRDDNGFYNVKEVAEVFAAMDTDRRAVGRENVGKSPRESSGAGEVSADDGDVPAIAISKAKKEAYAAEITRIKAERALGILVVREDVEATLEAIGAATSTAMLNMRQKLKPHVSDEGKKLVDRIVNDGLRDVGRQLEKLLDEQDKNQEAA